MSDASVNKEEDEFNLDHRRVDEAFLTDQGKEMEIGLKENSEDLGENVEQDASNVGAGNANQPAFDNDDVESQPHSLRLKMYRLEEDTNATNPDGSGGKDEVTDREADKVEMEENLELTRNVGTSAEADKRLCEPTADDGRPSPTRLSAAAAAAAPTATTTLKGNNNNDNFPEVRFSIKKRRTRSSLGASVSRAANRLSASSTGADGGGGGSDGMLAKLASEEEVEVEGDDDDSVFSEDRKEGKQQQCLDFDLLTDDVLNDSRKERRRRTNEFWCDAFNKITCRHFGRRRKRSVSPPPLKGGSGDGGGGKGGAADGKAKVGGTKGVPNPKLQQGERLMYPRTEYLRDKQIGKPLAEIDDFYSDTFVVINSKFEIYRFHLSRVGDR